MQTIEHVAVYHHCTVVQVIIQVQSDTYVTNHSSLTVAIEVLELFQVTVFTVALDGETVAVNCKGVLMFTPQVEVFNVTQVTGTTHCTAQVAVYHHSSVVQVIVVSHIQT